MTTFTQVKIEPRLPAQSYAIRLFSPCFSHGQSRACGFTQFKQLIYERLEGSVKLRCELCFEGEEYSLRPIPCPGQFDEYTSHFELTPGILLKFADEKWRIINSPNKLSEYHKLKQRLFLDDNDLPEDTFADVPSGQPILVCDFCSLLLDKQVWNETAKL